MVYGTVQRHQGGITIDTAPGRGTTFTIKLPATSVTDVSAPAPVAAVSTRPVRVLLVDDEEMVRTIVTAMLQSEGHTVVSAADGEAGLAAYRSGQFDVLIVDRAMPGLSGDQVAAAMKSVAPHLPIILLTGFGSLMNSMGEVPPGVDLVLGKPITLASLHEALATVLARPQKG
jgi:DNA-binding response OmpR family regulator